MITLEYSEEQGVFHNNIGDHEENSNGYKALGRVSVEDSIKFVSYVRNNCGLVPKNYDEIKELFDNIF